MSPTQPRRRNRTILFAAIALAVLVVAAAVITLLSAGGPPTVTFASVTGTLRTGPAQYCDLKVTQCENHPDAEVSMPVPPGQPLRVSVPKQVASTPWQVVFAYRQRSGEVTEARSPVFAPNQQDDYTLTLPTLTDQLVTAQVQQYGAAPPTTDQSGAPAFPIRASWVLHVP